MMILLKIPTCHRHTPKSIQHLNINEKQKTYLQNALDLFNNLFISNLCGMSLKIKACVLACT